MASLVVQRCFTHAAREAVCRCPECSRFFCRECVTLRGDRLICSSCFARLAAHDKSAANSTSLLGYIAAASTGFLAIWIFFYITGQSLLGLR